MKFGKRLAQEASRRWSTAYLDYKALKKALRDDLKTQGVREGFSCQAPVLYSYPHQDEGGANIWCNLQSALQHCVQLCNHARGWVFANARVPSLCADADAQGRAFQHLLVAELQKVSTFYRERSTQLEVRCRAPCHRCSGCPQPCTQGFSRSR